MVRIALDWWVHARNAAAFSAAHFEGPHGLRTICCFPPAPRLHVGLAFDSGLTLARLQDGCKEGCHTPSPHLPYCGFSLYVFCVVERAVGGRQGVVLVDSPSQPTAGMTPSGQPLPCVLGQAAMCCVTACSINCCTPFMRLVVCAWWLLT